MKKKSNKRGDGPMRAEYDFSKGKRGKYASQFEKGTNLVVLAPEIAEVFPNSDAVNDALGELVKIARRARRAKSRR